MKIAYKDLSRIRKENLTKRIVFCDGTFDLLHLAHIEHLQTISSYGEILVVGVMSDDWVKTKKGDDRPILSQEERFEMLDAIKYVDYTFILYDDARHQRIKTSEALRALRPDIFITTDSIWYERTKEFQKEKIEIRIVPPTPSATLMSTSKIIEKILSSLEKRGIHKSSNGACV